MRKCAFTAVLFNDGDDFVFDELPGGLPDEFFFVVELRIEIDVIHSAVCGHLALPVCGSWLALPPAPRFPLQPFQTPRERTISWLAPRCPHARSSARGPRAQAC